MHMRDSRASKGMFYTPTHTFQRSITTQITTKMLSDNVARLLLETRIVEQLPLLRECVVMRWHTQQTRCTGAMFKLVLNFRWQHNPYSLLREAEIEMQ